MKAADLVFAFWSSSANSRLAAFVLACAALLICLAFLFSGVPRSRKRKLLDRTQKRRDFWGYE